MILLLTPPFTQLNTPYPATAYLKGFLNTRGIAAKQADLGIEVILAIFCKKGLTQFFSELEARAADAKWSANARRIFALRASYIHSIDAVIAFLQGKNPTLAHAIAQEDYLPQASRFDQLDDLEWAFGVMGTQDKAKHLATLYLEDLSDLIIECLDPHFGFSRYAERLGRVANEFDELYAALQQPLSLIDHLLIQQLEQKIQDCSPQLVCISVPFPGNLFAAFRCAQWIKQRHPSIKTAMGGGFANTELRSLAEPRVFEFFDFITLDDGEAPVEHLWEHVRGERPVELLKRAFVCRNGVVEYCNHSLSRDYKQSEVGTPDYSDLPLADYISVTEIVNPMHRLWSDGRWNKLTMAHGCYWGKCTFCDISLDYIKVYEPVAAKLLCDRMEELIRQTGQTGFHFVDEAAPPALMRALALEILRRGLTVSWWTNIRFEKSFTRDLCRLLKASGCIGVSGGLEVASDRLLELIQKGVTVEQVARVCRNFTEAGILIHSYLMYAFPTQTVQETVDSLEMVRQLFEQGVLQSGFWHHFAMTAHSPVGLDPKAFSVQRTDDTVGKFANNDLYFTDPTGVEHERFSFGLKKSLFNFMHGIGFDMPLQDWFDFRIPRTTIPRNYIAKILETDDDIFIKNTAKVVWIEELPDRRLIKNKRGKEAALFVIHTKSQTLQLELDKPEGEWLGRILPRLSYKNSALLSVQDLRDDYAAAGLADFDLFWYNKVANGWRGQGLLVL